MRRLTNTLTKHQSKPKDHSFFRLIQELTTGDQPHDSRRRHRREPKSISLRIQPLDLDYRPDGEPFWAVSRDISHKGLGFVNPEPVVHEFVRIGLFEQEIAVIAKVCHSTSIGVKYPLFLVGVQFLDMYFD